MNHEYDVGSRFLRDCRRSICDNILLRSLLLSNILSHTGSIQVSNLVYALLYLMRLLWKPTIFHPALCFDGARSLFVRSFLSTFFEKQDCNLNPQPPGVLYMPLTYHTRSIQSTVLLTPWKLHYDCRHPRRSSPCRHCPPSVHPLGRRCRVQVRTVPSMKRKWN